jgi:ABC-type Fe3+ transport system permease subunit
MIMIIEILVLLLSVPVGFLIAYLANDELVVGRKWFRLILILSFIGMIYFIFIRKWIMVLSLGFILIVTGISYWKSFDKNWTKKRV